MKTIILAFALIFAGCGTPAIQHPGAVNAFDSNTYDILISVQASIEQAKSTAGPQFKVPLNDAIAAYNATMNAYRTYHAAATQGASPDASALQAQVNALVASVAKLLTQIKGVTP